MTDLPSSPAPVDFIREIVAEDLQTGRCPQVRTRFPPEPNGYLHLGHAKSICLNFGIAREYRGICNLRMDDTNPAKEETEYVDSIVEDVRWLIEGWADDVLGLNSASSGPPHVMPQDPGLLSNAETPGPFHASDYFAQIYGFAVALIKTGDAYVDDLSADETDRFRQEGKESPFRRRLPSENLALFEQMRAGVFPDGSRTLRAKIDMASPNVWLRDPVLYRIRHLDHHRTGNAWPIYPMYDFAHCLSDYLEGITHSICTLEFEVHRPLYDWILETLNLPRALPHQYEFARLHLSYTVLSKRKLMQLVTDGVVSGWDDPRMPTISGIRRRGVSAQALRNFAYHIGITKYDGVTEVAVLEHAIREDLNQTALRRLVVLRPLKVVITNYPEEKVEECLARNLPDEPESNARPIPFSRELYIEQDDFMEGPPPKYFRLRPGGEVRLKYAYIIKCEEVVKGPDGAVVELRCTADLESKSGGATASRKVKGTIHWVSAPQSDDAEVRLYDRLFSLPEPETAEELKSCVNPASLETIIAKCEPSLATASISDRYQFERLGYFTLDRDNAEGAPAGKQARLVFNRTITLKDAWVRETHKNSPPPAKSAKADPQPG